MDAPHGTPPPSVDDDAGSFTDLAALHLRYFKVLYRYAERRLGPEHDPADVVQEVFVRLLKTRPVAINSAYLYRAVLNEVRQRYARARTAARMHEALQCAQGEPLAPSPEYELDIRALGASLDQAIQALPPRAREAFLHCKVEGLTYAEAARAMGIAENTVKEWVRRARLQLRADLRDYAIEAGWLQPPSESASREGE